jgi:hypothetical protein
MRRKLLISLAPLAMGAVLAVPAAPALAAGPATVTKLEPNVGPPSGGTSVTITGTNFTGVTAVDFGGIPATSFTVNSETSITAVSPAHATGGVIVMVKTPEGWSQTLEPAHFTYGPTVTKLEPNVGPPSGGTSVTITGTNFTGATAVHFGPTAAPSFTVNSDTSITAVSPSGTGFVQVTVTTKEGTSVESPGARFGYGEKGTEKEEGKPPPEIKFFPKEWKNGKKLTTVKAPTITFGAITLENPTLEKLTCQTILTGLEWNETTEGTEKGLSSTTDYMTFECKAGASCKVKNTKGEEVEGIFATAEAPPVAEGTEAHLTGISSLPWSGEVIEREEGKRQILTHHIKVWIVFPPPSVGKGPGCLGTEIPAEDKEGAKEKEEADDWTPLVINGFSTNPLKPSHAEMHGEEGKTEKGFPETGRLISEAVGPVYPRATKLVIGGAGGAWESMTFE